MIAQLDIKVLLAQGIKAQALEAGFDLVGIASAEPSRHRAALERWLHAGHAGTMQYMTERFDERVDPAVYFPGAMSIICVAVNYHAPLNECEPVQSADQTAGQSRPTSQSTASQSTTSQSTDQTDARAAAAPATGRIARYALGDDYHEWMKLRLHALADWIRRAAPGAQTRCAVDTSPLLERELAARAGIGWIGKNTCVIHPRLGSWLFLGEILTSLDLPTDDPVDDHCGTCTACIDACPTSALIAPYQLDARRCISYLTIEHRGDIAPGLQSKIGDWLYGCDICQDVCPHNHRAPAAIADVLRPRFETGRLDANEVAQWDDATYRRTLRKSAIKRVKLPVLQRNARTVMANGKRPRRPQET